MRAFVLCHDAIWDGEDGVAANLTVATGRTVTVWSRDWDGERWGEPYQTEVDEYIGGYQHIGHIGPWGAYVLQSTAERLQAIDANAPANRWVPLYVINGGGGINNTVLEGARTKINAWLTNRGQTTVPTGWSNRRFLKRVYAEFEPEFSRDEVLDRVT